LVSFKGRSSIFLFYWKTPTLVEIEIFLDSLHGDFIIPAGQLAPGLYHYSLIINGEIVDIKKMTVTK
jgi:hypothetical protein